MLKLGFLMDHVSTIKTLEDTTFLIMEEAAKRGHKIFVLEPEDLVLSSKKGLLLNLREVSCDEMDGIQTKKVHRSVAPGKLDCLWIRKDPPFDLKYYHYLLLLVPFKKQTFMINDPVSVLLGNEKLLPFIMPEAMPETVTAYRKEYLAEFLAKKRKGVWKPLSNRSGHGVKLLEKNKTFSQPTEWGLIQEFMPSIKTKGDKRVFLLDGKAITTYYRTPPKGSWLVTPDLDDGLLLKASLTAKEKRAIKKIGPQLKRMGLYFVGIDMIGERITEINVTSPGGIAEANRFHSKPLQKLIVNFLERKLKK